MTNGLVVVTIPVMSLYCEYGMTFILQLFLNLCFSITSGDIVAMVIAKPDAIAEWREVIGPTSPARAREEQPDSLRAKYGTDPTHNAVHGSDSYFSAEREIKFMFPDSKYTAHATSGDFTFPAL